MPILNDMPPVTPDAVPAHSVVRVPNHRKAEKPLMVVSNRRHYNRIVDFFADPRAAQLCADRLNLGKD